METTFSTLYSDYKLRKELEHNLSVARANYENVKHEVITKVKNHEDPTQDLAERYLYARNELFKLRMNKVLGGYK